MEHHHGTLNYKGDVGDDLMGKVMGPTMTGKFMVCTGTSYDGFTDKTKAEFDEIHLGSAPVVINQ